MLLKVYIYLIFYEFNLGFISFVMYFFLEIDMWFFYECNWFVKIYLDLLVVLLILYEILMSVCLK